MRKKRLKEHILSHYKILIVDDSWTIRMMLLEYCRSLGFVHIEEAYDGREALDKILTWRPDLVFMDMHMPNLNGLRVCHKLQREHLTDDIIIIMLTSTNKPEFKVLAFGSGITDFITKPINTHEVGARMMMHLERLYMHRELEYNYARIQAELKEAAVLQRILLPTQSFLDTLKESTGLDIAYYYQAAMELGGDYLSVRKLSDTRLLLTMVDVSGHGVNAGLHAFSIHALLNEHILTQSTPGQLLELLNTSLYSLMPRGMFATMFIGVIDLERHQLEYAAAASPSPVIIANHKISWLNTVGYPLGIERTATYATYTTPFKKGDTLFLYSDALIETANAQGDFISEAIISQLLLANRSAQSQAMIRIILNYLLTNYSNNLTDDLSLLVVSG